MCSVVTPVICYHPVFWYLPCTLCCQGKALFIANRSSKRQTTNVHPVLCCEPCDLLSPYVVVPHEIFYNVSLFFTLRFLLSLL
jgi:hypothetical protein